MAGQDSIDARLTTMCCCYLVLTLLQLMQLSPAAGLWSFDSRIYSWDSVPMSSMQLHPYRRRLLQSRPNEVVTIHVLSMHAMNGFVINHWCQFLTMSKLHRIFYSEMNEKLIFQIRLAQLMTDCVRSQVRCIMPHDAKHVTRTKDKFFSVAFLTNICTKMKWKSRNMG